MNTVLAAATAELRDRCGYADADSAHAGAAVHWALVWERDGARVSLPLAKPQQPRGCTCASSVAAECQLREFWCPDCVGARVRLCGFRPSDSAAVRLPLTAVDVAWAGGEDAVVTLLSAAAERRQDETFSAVVVNSYKCCAHPMVLLAKGVRAAGFGDAEHSAYHDELLQLAPRDEAVDSLVRDMHRAGGLWVTRELLESSARLLFGHE